MKKNELCSLNIIDFFELTFVLEIMPGASPIEFVLRFREDCSFQHQHLFGDVVRHDTVMLLLM